jgi:hypothetical protein
MAVQTRFETVLPAQKPLETGRRPSARRGPRRRTDKNTLAIHPNLLMQDIAGSQPGLESYQVRGEAMQDAMVSEGDVIMLQRHAHLSDGELAMVELPGELYPCLRRIHFEGDYLRLEPENHRFDDDTQPADRVQIRGRVLAIMRQPR